MEWQHYARIMSSMAYIEGLLIDIEDGISGKKQIYKKIRNDMTEEQIISVKTEIKKIRALLNKTKKEFNLEHNEFALSHIINVDSNYIWTTIEDLWSHKMEKSSGKISSTEKKEKLDKILTEIYNSTTNLKRIVEK